MSSYRLAADALTLFRFVAAALVWAGLQTPYAVGETIALTAFIVGALSDYFDGFLARRAGGFTVYGRILDPLADKALTLAAFAGLASRGMVGWWLFWIVLARDVLVTAVRFRVSTERSAARSSGKWKTAFQMLFITVGLAVLVSGTKNSESPAQTIFMTGGSVIIAALTVWSGVRFLAPKKSSI